MLLARLRTFRLFAALLAVTMLFGSTLPLVQHAYAMAQAHRNLSGFGHTAMQHHASPVPSDEPLPCHNADDAEPRSATMGPCCFLNATEQASTMAALPRSAEVTPTPSLLAQPLILPDTKAHQPTDLWFDTGPPRARSIALHLLHAAFLI